MDYFTLPFYFPLASQTNHFLLQGVTYPWDMLSKIIPAITSFINQNETASTALQEGMQRNHIKTADLTNSSYFFTKDVFFTKPFIDKELAIFIDAHTLVEAGATIKSNVVIQERCQIRQGAYLREDCWISSHCTVGHTTEVKHSFFFPHSEAGHFAYIGDSILGSYTNLGAGTKLSNLAFRSLEEKQKQAFPPLFLSTSTSKIKLPNKVGAILGEGFESGCNSVLSPVALIGHSSIVFPCMCVLKGIYPPNSLLRDFETIKNTKLF